MPFKCSVPLCRGNYANGPNVSVFGFPKDECLSRKWLQVIHRKDFLPTSSSKVCELHFHAEDIIREVEYFDEVKCRKIKAKLSLPRLRDDAVPTLFASHPTYFSSERSYREDPCKKRARREISQLEHAIAASVSEDVLYRKKYCFSNIDELLVCLETTNLPSDWTLIKNDINVCLVKICVVPHPHVLCSVTVNVDLEVSVFEKHCELVKLENMNLPMKIDNVNVLMEIVNRVSDSKSKSKLENYLHQAQEALKMIKEELKTESDLLEFISEQLLLLSAKKNHKKYSVSLMVFCSLLFSISPHSYKFVRDSGFFILPHPDTLRKLCGRFNLEPGVEQNDKNFLSYVKNKFSLLDENDKKVVLLIDEIHLKPYLDYKGGSILGVTHNCENVATSACVFMINSMQSQYQDVVHVLPVKKLNAELLHAVLVKTIQGLESIGYTVFCVSSDNNAINRRTMKMFSKTNELQIVYQHPVNASRPLFYVIDAVHVFKCVRNNWLNQKNDGKAFFFPSFNLEAEPDELQNVASLDTLREVYRLECSSIVKYAHTLTAKALYPSTLERQNVKLVVQMFNNSVAEGLKIAGEKFGLQYYSSTAEFINIICRWFDIMNVGQIFKGQHKRNVFQEPLTSQDSDQKVLFLNEFQDWLERWEGRKPTTGFFTQETLLALKHTSYAVIEIARYCCEEFGMKYILTSKLQTDALEERFGQYRQLAGSQYHISVTQLFECEKKLRIRSFLPLALESLKKGKIIVDPVTDINYESLIDDNKWNLHDKIAVSEQDFINLRDCLPPLAYVAGYCSHAVLKKMKCGDCAPLLVTDKDLDDNEELCLIKSLDRGGLKYPSNDALLIVSCNYVVIKKLLSSDLEKEFLTVSSQRATACSITLEILENFEVFKEFNCPHGHFLVDVIKLILWTSCNIFLKNYCKNINSEQEHKKLSRKLKILKK